jgi:hypothetical protein
MPLRDNKQVHGRLGVDIPERQNMLIFKNDLRRNFFPDNPAK